MAWYHALPLILGQAQANNPAADNAVGWNLMIALAVIVGSFLGGGAIARWLRMPDYSFKIGLVVFTLVSGIVVNIAGWPPKRGIDLSGGVVLIYEIDKGQSEPEWMPSAIQRLSDSLKAGGERLEVKPNEERQIEIIAPEGVDRARIDRAVADLKNGGPTLHEVTKRTSSGKTTYVFAPDQQQRQTVDMSKLIAAVSRRINPSGVKELTIRQYGADQLEVIIPEIEQQEVEQIKKLISTSGELQFRIVANENDHRDIIRAGKDTKGHDVYLGGRLVGRWVKAGPDLGLPPSQATYRPTPSGREVLAALDSANVGGRYLSRASGGNDEKGNPAVHFSFNTAGAERFGQLTSKNLPDTAVNPPLFRHLGIILDNEMISAPSIQSAIHGEGQITGSFTKDYVEYLAGVLNAGSLPATLNSEPISQRNVSSQLGNDTIEAGTRAIVVSTAAILVFMAGYYRFCGVVADIAVVLNMVITVALMILIKAAFTLPGLAGLVLTVGMAVDANVLIYERMREETERGASLRMAIRNGFSRAMATIIDSHVTTLISAVVLYVVGTDQIKGFAVTLILGLLMSLFTAVFVARVIFDVAEKKRWLTRLNMLHLIRHTNIDFIRWRMPAIAGTVIITVIGLIAAASRGTEFFDIDFTGGSSVQLLFAEGKGHDIADVRRAVSDLPDMPDVAVSSVGTENLEFKIDTSQHDIKKVKALLQEKFGDSLSTYSMSYAKIEPIEEKPAASPGEEKPKAEEKSGLTLPGADAPAKTSEPAAPRDRAPKASDENKDAPPADTPKSSDAQRRHPIQLASNNPTDAVSELLIAQADEKAKTTADDKAPPSEPAAEKDEAAAKPEAADAKAADKKLQDTSGASMAGGTRAQLTFALPVSYAVLHDMVSKELEAMQMSDVVFDLKNPNYRPGSDAPYSDWTLEITLNPDQTESLLKNMKRLMASTPVFPSANQIGGKVASDTQYIALYALLFSMAAIVVYVWFRFENVIFGLAAVLALVHDVFVTIAFLAMSYYLSPYLGALLVDPFKISLAVVAALLTIVGFSINDTIVVFDRIREVRGKSPDLTEDMINLSVNATLSRTILTSGTVFIASIILYMIGGPGIHAFAYAMVVGVIAGTFSSVYIAAPVLLWMKKPAKRAVKAGEAVTSARA